MSTLGNPEFDKRVQALNAWTWLRRDVWKTREDAKKDLQSLALFKSWEPRVLDLYVVCHSLLQLILVR